MKTHSLFSRLSLSPLLRRSVIMLFALALSGFAFGGEIHDAVQSGDLEKVKALLKGNPGLVSSMDDKGRTPLHVAAFSGRKEVAELLRQHGGHE